LRRRTIRPCGGVAEALGGAAEVPVVGRETLQEVGAADLGGGQAIGFEVLDGAVVAVDGLADVALAVGVQLADEAASGGRGRRGRRSASGLALEQAGGQQGGVLVPGARPAATAARRSARLWTAEGVDAEVDALDVLVEEAVLVEQLAVEVGEQAAVELAVVLGVGDDEGAGEGVGDEDEDADLVRRGSRTRGGRRRGRRATGRRRLRSLRGLRPRVRASREYSVQATSGPPKWSARKPSIARCRGTKRRGRWSSRLAMRWISGVVAGRGLAAGRAAGRRRRRRAGRRSVQSRTKACGMKA
jgi:hypothetical protein